MPKHKWVFVFLTKYLSGESEPASAHGKVWENGMFGNEIKMGVWG